MCIHASEVVPQDNSYRKVFIRFGRGKSLAVENGVDGQAATGNDNGKMRMELEAQMCARSSLANRQFGKHSSPPTVCAAVTSIRGYH